MRFEKQKPLTTRQGFTLLELIVTLAVAAVITVIGAPSVSGWLAKQRLSAEAQTLWRDLSYARQHAALDNQAVIVCPSSDGLQCAGSRDWSDGWLTFVNADDDYPARRDANERVLAYHESTRRTAIRANRLAFRFRGFARRATNGHISLCDPTGRASARSMVVSYTGRARVDAVTDQGRSQCD